MSVGIDKQLCKLEKEVVGLKAHGVLPAYANASGEQVRALSHFLKRALQMGEASGLLGRTNLGTPLVVLTRVLCEDLFLCFWVSLSEKNAAQYCEVVASEGLRLVRILLENSRGTLRRISTREDKTSEVLGQLKGKKADGVKVDQLAATLGLGKVYDLIYRPLSMGVHGKAFGYPSLDEKEAIFAVLSTAVSLVKAIGFIADNRVLHSQTTAPDEILQVLGIGKAASK